MVAGRVDSILVARAVACCGSGDKNGEFVNSGRHMSEGSSGRAGRGRSSSPPVGPTSGKMMLLEEAEHYATIENSV